MSQHGGKEKEGWVRREEVGHAAERGKKVQGNAYAVVHAQTHLLVPHSTARKMCEHGDVR